MARPSIPAIRKYFREMVKSLRRTPRPWALDLATAIDTAMLPVKSWSGLPLFLKLLFYKDDALLLMLGDALVAARSESPWSDLCSRGKEPNAVYGDVFDAFMKRSMHVAFPGQCSTPLSPGKRLHDLDTTACGDPLAIEASVLGESKADRVYWDALTAERIRRRKGGIVGGNRIGNGYQAIVRLTEKFLDKTAKHCDLDRCQLAGDRPNVLMIGFPNRVSASPRGRDVGWALDQLFSEAPWEHPEVERVPTVWGVLRDKVDLARPDLTDPQARDDFMKKELWARFRRVGAVLLFDELRLVTARVNYNAWLRNRLSHAAIARLEETMRAAEWRPFTFLPSDHWHGYYPE